MSDRPRIVVTRRIPQPALDLLAEHGDVWLSPHDRPLTREELFDAVETNPGQGLEEVLKATWNDAIETGSFENRMLNGETIRLDGAIRMAPK